MWFLWVCRWFPVFCNCKQHFRRHSMLRHFCIGGEMFWGGFLQAGLRGRSKGSGHVLCENCLIFLAEGCTGVHSCQQRRREPVSPRPHPRNVSSLQNICLRAIFMSFPLNCFLPFPMFLLDFLSSDPLWLRVLYMCCTSALYLWYVQ